jgi:hypothetical protein
MKTASKVTVYDDKYQANYGKAPRGFGWWMFELMDASSNNVFAVLSPPRSMTYGDARKWVVAHVKNEYATELATELLYVEVAR